jgi:hypothetical protein
MHLTHTRTYAELNVSPECYNEIMHLLQDAGYDHAFHKDGGRVLIDMHGIALSRNPDRGESPP